MSFFSLTEEVEQLTRSISQNSVTVEDFLANNSIFNAISNQNKIILNFIFEKFDEIADYSFSLHIDSEKQKLHDNAFKILMSNSTPLIEFISQKQIFDNAIETFRQRLGTENDLMRPVLFIRHIFENCNPIEYLNEEDSTGFMQALLDNCNQLFIYDLLMYLINEQKAYYKDAKTQLEIQRMNWFIRNPNTFYIFLQSISNLQPNAFEIAAYLLCSIPRTYELHNQLTSQEMVTKLLEIALNPANIENISEKAFLLLVRIIEQLEPRKQIISYHKTDDEYGSNEEEEEDNDDYDEIRRIEEYKKNEEMGKTEVFLQPSKESIEEYNSFLEFLNSYSEQILGFIMTPGPFTPAKRLASEVLISISEQRTEFIPEIPHLFGYLFSLLQENPTCDFAALQLCKTLKDITNSDNREEFDFLPFCQWIMDITSNRSTTIISYWGVIDDMTNELNILISNQVIPLPPNWNDYITKYFIPRAQIIKKGYGGPAKNGNAYRYRCVDDFDVEKRKFELPSKLIQTNKKIVKKEFDPKTFEEEDDEQVQQREFATDGEEDIYEEEDGNFYIEEEEIYEYENES